MVSNKELATETVSWRQRMARRWCQRLLLERRLEGGQRLEEAGSWGLCCQGVEARDRSIRYCAFAVGEGWLMKIRGDKVKEASFLLRLLASKRCRVPWASREELLTLFLCLGHLAFAGVYWKKLFCTWFFQGSGLTRKESASSLNRD